MKKGKTAKKPRPEPARWFARDQKVFDRMLALGVPQDKIYKGWKGQTPEKFRMRAGEYLGVLDGLRAFGGKRDINKFVKAIHGQGATIIDIETGLDSRNDGVEMHAKATSLRQPLPESEKLAQADARRKANGQMLYHDAHATWFGPGTVDQKIEATGWSKGALYKAFKKSGGPTGRPPKNRN